MKKKISRIFLKISSLFRRWFLAKNQNVKHGKMDSGGSSETSPKNLLRAWAKDLGLEEELITDDFIDFLRNDYPQALERFRPKRNRTMFDNFEILKRNFPEVEDLLQSFNGLFSTAKEMRDAVFASSINGQILSPVGHFRIADVRFGKGQVCFRTLATITGVFDLELVEIGFKKFSITDKIKFGRPDYYTHKTPEHF